MVIIEKENNLDYGINNLYLISVWKEITGFINAKRSKINFENDLSSIGILSNKILLYSLIEARETLFNWNVFFLLV